MPLLPPQKMASSSSSPEIILTSSPDGPITAFNASTGAILAHFNGSRSPRKGLTVAGKTLIVTSHVSLDTCTCGSIQLYNWRSSTPFRHLPVPEPVGPLVATLDGSFLFCGGLSGHIHSLALPLGNQQCSFPSHSSPVSCLTVNDDGSLLLSGGDDGTISVFPILHLLDSKSNDCYPRQDFTLCRFAGHASAVTALTAGMGGCSSTILSCSLDSTCKFWSISNGSLMRTVAFPCMILGVAMDLMESGFYAGGSDGHVYAGIMKVNRRESRNHQAEMAEVVTWAPEHSGAVTAVAMANVGKNLISASEDGCIRVWEVESGQVVRVFWNERGSISELVVAKAIRHDSRNDLEEGQSLGFSEREISRPVSEVNEMEEMLKVVVKDRKRAIDTLEAAIGTYQRLLLLILKEAKGGGTDNNGSTEERIED